VEFDREDERDHDEHVGNDFVRTRQLVNNNAPQVWIRRCLRRTDSQWLSGRQIEVQARYKGVAASLLQQESMPRTIVVERQRC